MSKVPTGSPIDKLLGGGLENNTITNVYGPAGSGKTNITLLASIACSIKKKVVYIDTEGSFSLERFRQLGGSDKELKNIIFIEVHEWDEQHKKITALENLVKEKNVGLIVVDSLVALYRLELDDGSFQKVNRQLATQYSVLSKIARNNTIPVIVTNQVYSTGDNIELTSKNIGKYWSKVLIELKRTDKDNHRIAVLRKHRSLPEGKKMEIEINEKGMKEVKFFSL